MTQGSQVIIEASDLQQQLDRDLLGWCLKDNAIVREFQTTGWKSSLMLVNAIGYLAESAWHHPALLVNYSSVEVTLTTHSAGGITVQDINLAMRIDEIAAIPARSGLPDKFAVLKPGSL